MKKILYLLIIFSFIELVAHNERTHQYIVREAYKLLLLDLGVPLISKLDTHIGTTQAYKYAPFYYPFVVSGAYCEDWKDVIFHYGDNTGGLNATVTHFWQ